jgi:hypothetical protein
VRDIGAEERLLLAFCTSGNEHAASLAISSHRTYGHTATCPDSSSLICRNMSSAFLI